MTAVTCATPHNGTGGFNVPAVLGLWDMNNFNRGNMADYLGLKDDPDRVDTLPLSTSAQKAKGQAGARLVQLRGRRGTARKQQLPADRAPPRNLHRGAAQLRRTAATRQGGTGRTSSSVLFSAFLDTTKITSGDAVVFSVALTVSSTGYTIDNKLWLDEHEGEYLFRNTFVIKATRSGDGWNVRYLFADENSSEDAGTPVERQDMRIRSSRFYRKKASRGG